MKLIEDVTLPACQTGGIHHPAGRHVLADQTVDAKLTQQRFAGHALSLASSKQGMSAVPPELVQHQNNLKNHRKVIRYEIRLVIIEKHMRPALAFGCLCFVLIGCPVGIWFSRSDYLSAFITCFMPILFIYYPLLLCGNNMAKADTIPPVVALWIPNVAVAVIALPLYWRLLKH